MEQQWEIKQEDIDILEFGMSIIKVTPKKIPLREWAEYQTKISPLSEWHSHFCNQGTVGIITGKVSGNLEIIDVDVKNDPQGSIMDELLRLIPESLYERLIVQTTPNKGFHLIYRCPEIIIEGNQKLALHSNKEVIIETRGEGGYFCTSKPNNKILQGNLNLEALEIDIPEITKEEREFLLDTSRSLTRYYPRQSENSSKNKSANGYKEPAINEFNIKYPIIEVFEKHGWSVVNDDGDKYYLLRPGSSAAHSGYYFKDTNTFFCFSTSTGFKPEKPYNNFQILQILEGENDYNKTLRLLQDYGYSTSQKKDNVSLDDISTFLNDKGVSYDSFIQDLTLNGKIIEEIDYNTLFIDLKEHFGKVIPRTRFEEVIKSRYVNEVNPVEKFIQDNEDRKPNGSFEKWLDCISLKNKNIDKTIVLHFLKKWYVGMIAQALEGEYPNEFFLCLLSTEQGIGKTTFLRNYTLPSELKKYRAEHSLSFDDDFKVIMGQTLLIIDDEMDGRTYESEKTFKSVMSQKELTSRRKYDRRISTIKRRCSFAGSGNNLNVIREHQNRRIIPIEIERLDFKKMEQMDYRDLFMEAYQLYKSGFKYSYQHDDMTSLKHLYEDYVQKTDVDMVLDDQILMPESEDDIHYISALDFVTTLGDIYPQFSKRINVINLGKLLNNRGYNTIRKGRNKTTHYEISKNSKIITLIRERIMGGTYLS
jgi:hypothetical protein